MVCCRAGSVRESTRPRPCRPCDALPGPVADADLVVEVNGPYVSALAERLKPDMRIDPQMQFETVPGTYKNRISVEDSPFTIELFRLSDDDHDRERFRRRTSVVLDNCPVFSATPEDIIVMKLRGVARVDRVKDRKDIEVLLYSSHQIRK